MTINSDLPIQPQVTGFIPFNASLVEVTRDYVTNAIEALANDNEATHGKRYLTEDEKELARSVYGDSIDLDKVLINETSALADANKYLPQNSSSRPFVFGNTINTAEPLSDAELIHELGHVWQYQTEGWGYLQGAADEDYDVSLAELEEHENDPLGERLDSFGIEEQAEIAKDYFELKQRVTSTAESGAEVLQADVDRLNTYAAYIEEFKDARPLDGVVAEANEAIEEYLGETGEATEEVIGELLNGNSLGVIREIGEGAFEVNLEALEGALEFGSEVVDDVRDFLPVV